MDKCCSLINLKKKIIDIFQNGFLQKLSIFLDLLQEVFDIFEFSIETFDIFNFFSIKKISIFFTAL